ncbi:uncharacterized protein LY89DRAFT_721877 [Mollisia scopiformis]|uniref:RRM domain-containing protein n=1 Tax=Mollisia scopiformis TaxID=149040 RepID=A0A194WYT3_MOLSC|nr:uncharacterized protein LY89DRAFT_721877 [Mollisia scopiformis]KUJ13105.1 hypothetical protein LY89DRAFT_721877 [Mollisia scopiformis]
MVLKPCGDETGEYYLIVSSLPWSATWQKLKDFVRYPETGGCINVEHVFIYPSATDGWVKIRGREDFERAYDRSVNVFTEFLNGRVFEGKAIVADGRNGHSLVNLRDLEPIQTSSKQPAYIKTSPPDTHAYTSSSTKYNQQTAGAESLSHYQPSLNSIQDFSSQSQSPIVSYSSGSTTYSNEMSHSLQSANYASSSPCTSFSTQSFNYAAAPTSQNLYMANPPPTPIYARPVHMGFALVPMAQIVPAPPAMKPQYQYPPAEEAHHVVVHTEARKVIITDLSHSITEKELRNLLERAAQKSRSRSATPAEEYPIASFDIPRHSDGKAKGHAFVVFSSPHIAQRVMDALHGKRFQRRELKVRWTKEGADSKVQQTYSTQPPIPPRSQVALATFAPQMDQTYSAQPLIPPRSRAPPAAPTLQTGQMWIAGDSNTTSTSTEPKKEKRDKTRTRTQDRNCDADSEREIISRTKSRNSERAPMVVDGTGGKRRHR